MASAGGRRKTWQRRAASYEEILQAGGWGSAAFMAYMKAHELETGACAQLIADHSDSEPEAA